MEKRNDPSAGNAQAGGLWRITSVPFEIRNQPYEF